MKKWIKVLLTLLCLLLIAGGIGLYIAFRGTKSAKDAKPVAEFTSETLSKTITADPKSFMDKYTLPKDDLKKIIGIKGKISKISTADPKNNFIEINNEIMNITFSWDESRTYELKGLKAGSEVNVKGIIFSINGFDKSTSNDPMDLESQKEAKLNKCCLNN
jgi:hypothetical protein